MKKISAAGIGETTSKIEAKKSTMSTAVSSKKKSKPQELSQFFSELDNEDTCKNL